ncbi:MAG: AAA family ATPase [Candidatus Binatia bacterium]|jgi:hypothetical protein
MSHSPLQIAACLQQLRREPPVLIGRERELAAIRAPLRARHPLFVSGPFGVGKSALLQAAYGEWSAEQEGFPLLYCGESSTRRGIATHMLVNLFLQRGRLESRYIERRKTVASLSGLRRFLADERLADLKRMMHQNLGGDRACLLLDHLDDPDPKVAALIEVWLERMPLVLVARHAEAVGRVRWLLSSFECLELLPLPEAALLRMARDMAGKVGDCLRETDLHQAVALAAGNPAQLQRLLHAAARPEYQKSGAIQWKLLELDQRIRAIGLGEQWRIRRRSA